MAPEKKSPVAPVVARCCSAGVDVRLMGETSRVPSTVRDEILFDSGPINAAHKGTRPAEPNSDYPSRKLVVVAVASTDYPPNPHVTPASIRERFFGTGQSIATYFSKNSWGRFVPSLAGPCNWVSLPGPLASFGGVHLPGLERLVGEVLSRAEGIDWPGLDTDGNGIIRRPEATFVLLIPNADSAATRGNAHTRSVSSTVVTSSRSYRLEQGVVVYSLVEAADPEPAANPFRTFSSVAHELCHAWFDLPDRYGSGGGTGPYDLMATDRSWKHMNIHDKMKLGWFQPKLSFGHNGQCLAFPASAAAPAALVVVSPAVTPNGPGSVDGSEYWIVENRHKGSAENHFDDGLPESGLAVWWVGRGGWPGGHDDVRLVDFSRPDQSPRSYGEPRNKALLSQDPAHPVRSLLTGGGGPSYAWVRGVSATGATMYAEF